MQRRKFSREYKLEAVKLVREREVTPSPKRSAKIFRWQLVALQTKRLTVRCNAIRRPVNGRSPITRGERL